MKIVVFSPDIPFPPNRGGRADIWRRIEAFVRLGHEVMLVNLYEPAGASAPKESELRVVDSVVARRFSFPIKRSAVRTISQLAGCWRVPWHAATRIPDPAEFRLLRSDVAEFKPDLFWLDGPWFGVASFQLAAELSVSVVYRSHNIEHVYLPRQARAAVRWRDRLAWMVASAGLERFEYRMLRQAQAVFDISVDDLNFWKARGVPRLHWLPPLSELALREKPSEVVPGDVVFVGNLGTPNNVRGVEWLIRDILPYVQNRFPRVTFRIVGSNPTPFIRGLMKSVSGVELAENVKDVQPYLFGAKVLVNPVMSGSGVQVKMLDMLMTNAPIITAHQGTKGLPDEFRLLFRVFDETRGFAEAICDELQSPTVDIKARERARESFSIGSVDRALDVASGGNICR